MTTLQIRLAIAGAVVTACILFWVGAQQMVEPQRIKDLAAGYLPGHQAIESGGNAEGLAYMTFLTGTMVNKSDPNPDHDHYFVATRLLGYQLLHAPETRTKADIPFVVLVTEDVPESKRERLSKDGATVIVVEYLRDEQGWIVGEMPEWRDVMTKLRAWELTQYSRVAFLDGDMILNRCMDGLFYDAATRPRKSNSTFETDEPIPSEYLLASIAETNPLHAYPPTVKNNDFKDSNYFNAGFFVFSPSQAVFDYYRYLMEHKGSFDPQYPEQNLMNHAHRQNGSMPWQHMNSAWNIRFPTVIDKEGNVASMHDKWWHAHMDPNLQPYYTSLRWTMEGFYKALDMGAVPQAKNTHGQHI